MEQPRAMSGQPRAGRHPTGRAVRLADVLASLSLIADLGFGLPPEDSMRACLIATALGRRLRLAEAELAEVYYTTLLQHIGCTGFAHETAHRYGDELAVNAAAARTDLADPRDVFATYLPAVTRGRGPLDRVRIVLRELIDGGSFGRRYATAACEVGQATARRLGLSTGIQRGLHEVYEWWNGKGGAQGLRGEAISLPARIAQLGATAALFAHLGGREVAMAAVRRQAGGLLDPSLVRAFLADATAILSAADAVDVHLACLDAEPAPFLSVPGSRLPEIALAIADVADLKSRYTLGHSSGVSRLATGAGMALVLEPAALETLRTAALLHDVGRVGISTAIWEHPGPLSGSHWEQVRLHAYHSERILARSALAPLAELAGRHHERLDGSGYHRGSRSRDLPLAVRVLAAADVVQAMGEARAHRPALGTAEVVREAEIEARSGRLDPEVTTAVLEVAGHAAPRLRREAAAGLSEREVEILQALARGLSNRQIAERFAISPRTAEHHVQHIYTKIGASSRAAAALFAMEHDLLD
jgi:HD-GYP domain-containing protein (c-di-GMP phosphodiesterase class II)